MGNFLHDTHVYLMVEKTVYLENVSLLDNAFLQYAVF